MRGSGDASGDMMGRMVHDTIINSVDNHCTVESATLITSVDNYCTVEMENATVTL